MQRLRFDTPSAAVVITSLKERIFCAGANIFMLRGSTHAWKINFCKFTNETRLAMEDASQNSGLRFLAAVNGICAGGGYELALACDEIFLVDDGNSAVSLPETPLLGVLPGTGGLTRVVDKRKVRRDLADVFGTVAEGIKGKRAVEWRLVDAVYPTSQFKDRVAARVLELARQSDRPAAGPGITLGPLGAETRDDGVRYSSVMLDIDRGKRVATLTVRGPEIDEPATPDAILAAGDRFWPLRAFRELDDALLRLRINEPLIGTVVVKTEGDAARVLAVDETLARHTDHWLVREIVHFIKRTLKRMDLTSRSFFAFIEPGSCYAGTLFELALAADRSYMLDDPDRPNTIALSSMNAGPLKMSNGLTRLETRFLGQPEHVGELLADRAPLDAREPMMRDSSLSHRRARWDDEVRLAVESVRILSGCPDRMERTCVSRGPRRWKRNLGRSPHGNWISSGPAVGRRRADHYGSQAGRS